MVALAGLIWCCAAYSQPPAYSKLVVFGDSLSDTGNLAIFTFPFPYFNNRISDGPLMVDVLASAIEKGAEPSAHLLGRIGGFNYAVAGGNIVGSDREDLSQQVSAYLQRVNNQADPNALYLVFAGGNDVRNMRSLALVSDAERQIALTVSVLSLQILRLQQAGARMFIIPNVANIARLPETITRNAAQVGLVARADAYSRAYNRALQQRLIELAETDSIAIVAFDFFAAVERVLIDAASFGFSNITEGCFDADEFTIASECLLFGFERRVFFDSLHPSSASNRIIGAQLAAKLPPFPFDARRPVIVMPAIHWLLLDE